MKLAIAVFLILFVPSLLWNHQLFLTLNSFNHPALDLLISNISGLADGLVSLILILMLMLFQFRLGLAGLLAFFVSGLLAQILKRIFDMPRPPSVFENIHILGDALGQHSFPSGHATTAGMMALFALYIWKTRHWAWLVFAVFTIAAYGRIYAGIHFPLDVVTGFGIGALSMWWSQRLSRHWPVQRWSQSEWSWKIPGLALMISAVTLGTGYHIQPATAQALTLIIPLMALFTLMHAWKTRLHP